jgi:hypothetical protein
MLIDEKPELIEKVMLFNGDILLYIFPVHFERAFRLVIGIKY